MLRWSVVLLPMLVTVAWYRGSAAQPRQPTPTVVAALPPVDVPAHALAHRPEKRTPPEAEPEPAPDPCAIEDVQALRGPAREVFSGPDAEKIVALTFDDGPSRENTPRVLEILRRAQVHATFFVLGDRAERMGDLLQDIDEDGHEIGNHGFSHTSMRSLWKSQIKDEVCRTQRAVEVATGKTPTLVRPPFGRYPPSAVPLLGGLGYDVVLWSVDAGDWKDDDDPIAVATRVVRAAQPGAIILMHDREAITAEALPYILGGLKRHGYRVVPVSALIGGER